MSSSSRDHPSTYVHHPYNTGLYILGVSPWLSVFQYKSIKKIKYIIKWLFLKEVWIDLGFKI
jgi:hypothetical protein